MTDQNSQFFAILTAVGKAKQANADALGVPWTFAQMGVGDANNTEPMPSEQQTKLINERRRAPLNQLKVDPNNPNIIIAEQVIPESVGGWWIREIGLYDTAGDLVAVANCAPSFKPLLSQGSGRTQVVRMNLIVSNTANVELKIDPSIVLATRSYVDAKVLEEIYKLDSKQSVRVATTGNIALTGLQSIDGVVLVVGDRVLVKNQTLAKDNGLYTAATGAWVRTEDTDSSAKVTSALLVSVEQGLALADTRWQLVTDGVIVLGSTALTFQDVTASFARLLSPRFMGNPTAPTPGQFDNSKAIATTEFVRGASGSYRGFTDLAAPSTLTAAAIGTLVTTVGTYTVTLPPADVGPAGSAIHFRNPSTGVVSIVCAGSDQICFSGGHRRSIDLLPDSTLELVSNGDAGWWPSGSAQFQYSNVLCSTPPQFDSTKTLATTEFVRRALGSRSGYIDYQAASGIIPVADAGKYIGFNRGAAQSYALPDANTLPLGTSFYLEAVGGDVSLSAPNSKFAGPAAQVVSPLYVLRNGTACEFIVISNIAQSDPSFSYRVVGGVGKALVARNGYERMPNGLIRMWGSGIAGGHPDQCAFGRGVVRSVYNAFPVAFPNELFGIVCTHYSAGVVAVSVVTTGETLNGFNAAATLSNDWQIHWQAIGR
ncbi:phage tail protein [Pseudomonas sp. 3MA1]|uniref:phage tail protein n=1 Tax=Pseudomonas sp. 3MA1 TaxID=2699196 RepID=UPI0023DDC1D3|nr:phage tail protein [Pseudomonas sp. 3MA1]